MATELDNEVDEQQLQKDVIDALTKLISDFEKAESSHRATMIQEWKALHLFWNGYQTILWDPISKDWVSTGGKLRDSMAQGVDKRAAARIINIYQAHGESIIAALTTGLPKVSFFPFNAEMTTDITTAKGATKLGDKIQKDNDAPLMFIYALFILFNEGLIFSYNYYEEDEEYGYDEEPITESAMQTRETLVCSDCGSDQNNAIEPLFECATCGSIEAIPEIIEEEVEEIVGYEKSPHGKECIQIWGPLNVTVPHHIKELKYSPYLILEQEEDASFLMELYPEKAEEIKDKGTTHSEARWARRDIAGNFGGDEQVVTHKKVWLQKFAFNKIVDKEIRDYLNQNYTQGAVITYVDDIFIKIEDENMLKHWTETISPLSKTIHAKAPGSRLKSLQRLENELANLALDQVRHSIGQTFANPDTVDFPAYSNLPASPGTLYPAKPNPGDSLSNSFHQIKAANLSQEVSEFHGYIEKRSQFVTGAFPSIYGGNIQGSRTASEYSESKNQALQRLSIMYKTVVSWWTRTVEKSTREFISKLVERGKDTFSVSEVAPGAYKNDWIRVADLSGKVGMVVPESSERFPLSKDQQKEVLLELMSLQKDYIDNTIIDPANISMVADTLGFPGFNIPGAQDREKQLREIAQLLQETVINPLDELTGGPILGPDKKPMPPQPSVPTEPQIDNVPIHIAIIKLWANSEEGQEAKVSNPEGYANVMAHLSMHEMEMAPMVPPEDDLPVDAPQEGQI